MSRQSELLASKGAYVDSGSWIEEFFCGDHGKLWMKVTRRLALSLLLRARIGHKQPAQFYQTPKSVSKRIHLPHESSDWDKVLYGGRE